MVCAATAVETHSAGFASGMACRLAGVSSTLGATLLTDPAFRPHILEPLEVYGVDDFQPQIVLKGRIKTVPLKQWTVGRELRKRLAAAFKARDIQLPVAHMNVTVDDIDALLGKVAARSGRKPEA